jgi:type I restriction enzyme, S subunit
MSKLLQKNAEEKNSTTPKDWGLINLGKVAKFNQGLQVSTNEQLPAQEDDTVRFIRIVDFTKKGEEPVRYVKNVKNISVYSDENDLIMIRYGSQTAGKIVRGLEGIIANNMFKISLTNSLLDKNYLYYYLSQKDIYDSLNRAQSSSTMPAITFGMMNNLEIPIPPKTQQKMISEIISSLDDKIELNQKINSNLEKFLVSLFKQWFVDFEFPNINGKPYKSNDGEMIDTSLGLIPSGWEAGSFGKVLKEKTDRVSKIYNDIIVLSAVNTGELIKSEDYFNKQVFSKSLENYKLVNKFDFAYNPSRINIGSIGMLESDFQGAVSPIYIVFTPKNNYQYFIQNLLNLDSTKEYIKQFSSGSVRQALNFKDFSSIPIIVPPEEIIKQFNEFEVSLKEVRKSMRNEIKTLENIRDSLLPKLMSGKIRVNI